jgi:hypothetical protein
MTSTSARPTATGHFMLTLGQLAAPVAIPPLDSPQLKPFTFFMSRARRPDGSEQLYLHMGYFETLADAETWVDAVRRHYPNAFATIAPVALLRPAHPEAPALPPVASLTDTQVLRILDTRRASAARDDVDESPCDQIELLRPEDTGTRQALKEAVVRGAPVSFAVQLQWSAEPIDLSRVPSFAIFRPYTLYATETCRKGRSRCFLRLGFFADPLSAKQVAVQVRSTFASAAVVPILEQEVARAREAAMSTSAIPYLVEQPVDRGVDSNGAPGSPTPSEPLSDAAHRLSQGAERAAQTLEPPAGRELHAETDLLSESGVRHLRVEVQEQSSGRWRVIRLGAIASDMVQVS